MKLLTDGALVTTTGYLSRQAYFESDRDETFYMQGSMGHAAAIGLGLAISPYTRRVVVLDGDGAFLMHMGTGSTVGASQAERLVHLVVDNRCYESTGCQGSTSASVHWESLGRGLGYKTVLTCGTRADLRGQLAMAMQAVGPVLCVFAVDPTPDEVHPRATNSISPEQITKRFGAAVRAETSVGPEVA
jgi:phosphonopyruvate decarboxylase